MSQLNYGYGIPKAVAGQKADISPIDVVVARKNSAADGALKFGMAAAVGTQAGNEVVVPSTTNKKIDGVVLHAQNVEQERMGGVELKKNDELGIIQHGHVWVRLKDSEPTPTYHAPAYVCIEAGDDAGTFTATQGTDNTDTVDIGAVFGNQSEDGLAIIEF